MMSWWRAYHGMAFDPKLAVIAKRCNAKRCEVLAIWVAILEFASSCEDRGSIAEVDAESISVSLDCDVNLVGSVLSAFEEKGMLEAGRIKSWDKLQYEDSSAERTRRYREKRRDVTPVTSQNVTERHSDGCDGSATSPSVSVSVSESDSSLGFKEENKVREIPKTREVAKNHWPPGFDFVAWIEERDRKHPIPGKPQLAIQYAQERIFVQFTPEQFNTAHDAWCEYWKGQDGGIPSLAVFINEAWWRKLPPKRAPPNRKQGFVEDVKQAFAERLEREGKAPW